jgi:hypothetical protein
MRKLAIYCCFLILTLLFGHKTFAQDASNAQETPKSQDPAKAQAPPVHYYHLDIVTEELGANGKPFNSRTDTTTVNTDTRGRGAASIRSHSRIPVATGPSEVDGKPVNRQYTYQDVGIDIDVQDVHEIGRQLALNLTADISSLAEAADPMLHEPVVRHIRWQAAALIPIDKPTIVFTSDVLDSKNSIRMVVTATLLQ